MTPDEWYEREYRKTEAREDARDDARRRRAYEAYCREQDRIAEASRRRMWWVVGCLGVPSLFAAGCMGLTLFGLIAGGRPTTPTAAVPTGATEREHTPPTTAPVAEVLPRPITLTPRAGSPVVLCKLPQADRSPDAVKLSRGTGLVRELAEPTAVILLARYDDECKVRYDGADWFVPAADVPPK